MQGFTPLRGRTLVTGAAGFIGSALIWALNTVGCDDVIACDRLDASGKFRNLVPLRFHDYVDADDLDAAVAEHGLEYFGEIRAVVHLGACSSTTERDAQYLLRNNHEFSKRLATAAFAARARLVYASSAATYGAREATLSDRDEIADLRPLNAYAYSKQLFDLHARRSGWLERCAGVKYFNVFGPNEAHKGEMRSVLAKAYDRLSGDEAAGVPLFRSHRADYRDGEQRRDFVYVKDAVAATLFLAADPRANGLFNVGSGEATTWNDLVGHLFAALGRPPKVAYVNMPEPLRGAYQYSTRADLSRLRAAGFDRPMDRLAEAVADYVAYLRADARLDPLEPTGPTGPTGPSAPAAPAANAA